MNINVTSNNVPAKQNEVLKSLEKNPYFLSMTSNTTGFWPFKLQLELFLALFYSIEGRWSVRY